jgi:hypothetical protein
MGIPRLSRERNAGGICRYRKRVGSCVLVTGITVVGEGGLERGTMHHLVIEQSVLSSDMPGIYGIL